MEKNRTSKLSKKLFSRHILCYIISCIGCIIASCVLATYKLYECANAAAIVPIIAILIYIFNNEERQQLNSSQITKISMLLLIHFLLICFLIFPASYAKISPFSVFGKIILYSLTGLITFGILKLIGLLPMPPKNN